jgi:hypothetical protein
MVLQRRFIYLRRKKNLIGAVGLHRVQMLGAFGKSRIKYIFFRIRDRIWTVPRIAAAGAHQNSKECGKEMRRWQGCGLIQKSGKHGLDDAAAILDSS